MSEISFRFGTREDIGLIKYFITELAIYEEMLDDVEATEEMLEKQLFDDHRAEVIFGLVDEKEIGFALFFHNFSTFLGRSGLYLEDIFILEEHRNKGYGKTFFLELAKIASDRGCGRMEWTCLNWNTPSINFYKSMGAHPMDEWTTYRLTKGEIDKLINK